MADRGLPRRLGRDLVLQAIYISIAAFLSVTVVAALLEGVLMRRALQTEADFYWERAALETSTTLPRTFNMTGYREGFEGGVPTNLRDLEPGFHDMGGGVIAHVSDRDGNRLFLTYKALQVGELVLLFGLVPLGLALMVLYIALYSAYRVTRRAVSPFVELADRVSQLDPARPDSELFNIEARDEEVQVLASSMQELTERLDAFTERERTFTRDASHELRSPLTIIKMAASAISRESLSNRAAESLGRIRQAADDMEQLTHAFLLLARESQNQLPASAVDVGALVDDEAERGRWLSRNRIGIRTLHHESLSICAPEAVLASVIGNLIRNGIHYTQSGEVTIAVFANRVEVSDTGPGMSEDELSEVFKPFVRGESGSGGGHGVGLTIVSRLSDRFGWQVAIDSEPGKGTRAVVTFDH